ncbi:hypothetical protein TrRE_jg3387, partial [Triparma retinervis]
VEIEIFRVVAAVLQCGNIQFEDRDSGGEEGSAVVDSSTVSQLSSLTGFSVDGLITALTYRTMKARDDSYMVPLTKAQAEEGRDAFSKSLYDALFRGLVGRINDATEAKEGGHASNGEGNTRRDKGGKKEHTGK